jgi:hypothetical protein
MSAILGLCIVGIFLFIVYLVMQYHQYELRACRYDRLDLQRVKSLEIEVKFWNAMVSVILIFIITVLLLIFVGF